MRVAVLGAGSWGTTFAALSSSRARTVLWARRADLAAAINRHHRNPDYLTDAQLPLDLTATGDIDEAVGEADLVVLAVPSHGFRAIAGAAAGHIQPGAVILSLTKGVEQRTLALMTDIVRELLPDHPNRQIGVLTGPNLAPEVMAGQPTASVAAFEDLEVARVVQELLMSPSLRVYTNRDVVGCEIAGSVKNVLAIAAGMARGLGFGDNTMAALITRSLAELTRLGVALGGDPRTFAGLAGMGDLIATCISPASRNFQVGFGLGRGRKLDQITSEMRMIAEGVRSTEAVLALAARHDVEVPISEQVGRVLYQGVAPSEAVLTLMTRAAREELDH
ncbi:MAG TPA: NAD(P)H-dependent glycerol-3-phosphate dehydrogenase [Acidimicrobiia bacterium]